MCLCALCCQFTGLCVIVMQHHTAGVCVCVCVCVCCASLVLACCVIIEILLPSAIRPLFCHQCIAYILPSAQFEYVQSWNLYIQVLLARDSIVSTFIVRPRRRCCTAAILCVCVCVRAVQIPCACACGNYMFTSVLA